MENGFNESCNDLLNRMNRFDKEFPNATREEKNKFFENDIKNNLKLAKNIQNRLKFCEEILKDNMVNVE